MRRGTAIPALIALAIGVLIVRLRRARAGAVPRPVAGSSTAGVLPAAPPVEAELAMSPPTDVPMPTTVPAPASEPEIKPAPEPELELQPPTARFLSAPWQLSEPASDGSELTISFTRDERMALDRVDVQETPTQVFITVIVRADPSEGERLTEAVEETAAVVLARPLGERELIHGTTDADDDEARRHYP